MKFIMIGINLYVNLETIVIKEWFKCTTILVGLAKKWTYSTEMIAKIKI